MMKVWIVTAFAPSDHADERDADIILGVFGSNEIAVAAVERGKAAYQKTRHHSQRFWDVCDITVWEVEGT